MREELNDSITKTVVNFVTQLHETEDEFIFETISPFCTDILHRRISKKELKEMLLRAERMKWIPAENTPEVNEEGYSERILLNFENASIHEIGRYIEDGDGGGAYYIGDDVKSCLSSYGLFVNAWMPLPERYKEEE
jgi:hypothetical protein|nr:MAG TPA: hypothetical protein [Caudoviricetes sp.]